MVTTWNNRNAFWRRLQLFYLPYCGSVLYPGGEYLNL